MRRGMGESGYTPTYAGAVVLLLLALAGCGADGEPVAPEPGVRISGEASVGVTGRL